MNASASLYIHLLWNLLCWKCIILYVVTVCPSNRSVIVIICALSRASQKTLLVPYYYFVPAHTSGVKWWVIAMIKPWSSVWFHSTLPTRLFLHFEQGTEAVDLTTRSAVKNIDCFFRIAKSSLPLCPTKNNMTGQTLWKQQSFYGSCIHYKMCGRDHTAISPLRLLWKSQFCLVSSTLSLFTACVHSLIIFRTLTTR